MTIINITTFVANETQPENCIKYNWKEGTVEATIQGKTKRVKATLFCEDEITAYGFVAKYRTGTKLWDASVSRRKYYGGKIAESVMSGFDSRSGKHHMIPNVWFKDDVNENMISKR